MKKILFIPLLFMAICLSAAPMGEKKAREIAESFFSSVGTRSVGQSLELEYVAGFFGTENVFVYNRAGGGFAVIAGDDRFTPVIAYSYENSFDSENMPDAARHLLDCWAKQIHAGRIPTNIYSDTPSVGNTVVKYDTPLWNQGEPYNREAPVINNRRCVTGCVATALSIVLYHNRWPEKGSGILPSYSYELQGFGKLTIPSNTLGRKYDYDNMLSDYNNGYNDVQANAVAALMKDMGSAVQMAYGPDASSAGSDLIPRVLSQYFSYSKSSRLVLAASYDDRGWTEAMQQNISAYGPTYVAGHSDAGGHAFVADGYTDRGYICFNFGWGGNSNGWYLMPSIEYNGGQNAVFGLVPDRDGTSTYKDVLSLYSYNDGQNQYNGLKARSYDFIPGAECSISMMALVNSGQVDFNGKFKISVCSKFGIVKSDLTPEVKVDRLEPMYLIGYEQLGVVLPSDIAEGDRVRVLYKGEYSDSWNWARKFDEDAFDEIILCPTPEELAESMKLAYSKTTKMLTFSSIYSIEWSLKDSASSTLASGNTKASGQVEIDVSTLQSGSYHLSVSSGGRPYELILTF